MEVPISFKKAPEVTFSVLLEQDSINMDHLMELGAGSNVSGQEDIYKEAISKWFLEYINSSLTYSTIMSFDEDGRMHVLGNYYKMDISPQDPGETENYLVVNEKAMFPSDQNVQNFDDSTAAKFPNLEQRRVEFYVPGDKNPIQLAVYISPEFNSLDIPVVGECNFDNICNKESGETPSNCRSDCKPWGWAVFWIALILFFGFILYLILQAWYNKRYENYLFKNKNDLFNLVNFLNNAIQSGMRDEDAANSLRRAGWHSEQIAYAIKKVRGKKTGMPLEIGIKNPKTQAPPQARPTFKSRL
jgi:hypothetical protein